MNQWATRAPERTVGCNMNASVVAEVNDLLLREHGVVFDLVDCRNNLGMREKLFQILDAVVGNTNGFCLPTCDQFLHIPPGIDMRALAKQVAAAISKFRKFIIVS